MPSDRFRIKEMERIEKFSIGAGVAISAGRVFHYPCKDAGIIEGIEFSPGNDIGSSFSAATAGLRVVLTLLDSTGTAVSGDRGDFGVGSATNADSADDKVANAKAGATASLTNAGNQRRFNKGDIIKVTITPDGSATFGELRIKNKYDGIGRA